MRPSEAFLLLQQRARNRNIFSSFGTFDTETLIPSLEFSPLETSVFTEEQKGMAIATSFHENIHWVQHVATSLGIFKTCLQYSQFSSVLGLVKLLPANRFKTPFLPYLEKNQKELDGVVGRTFDRINFSSALAKRAEGLLHKERHIVKSAIEGWAHTELVHFTLDGNFDNAEYLTLSLHDSIAFTFSRIHGLFDLLGHKADLPSDYFFNILDGDPPIKLIITEAGVFGAFQIFEGQARYMDALLLHEHYILHSTKDQSGIDAIIKRHVEKPRYSMHYNSFRKIALERLGLEVQDNLLYTLFLIVCDFTVNPLWPPLPSHFKPEGIAAQLFPSFRFFEVSVAVLEIATKEIDFDIERFRRRNLSVTYTTDIINHYNQFLRQIYRKTSELTYIPSPLDVAALYADFHKELHLDPLGTHDFLRYHLTLFSRACEMRLKHPVFFVDPGFLRLIDPEVYWSCFEKIRPPVMGIRGRYFPVEKKVNYLDSIDEYELYVQKVIATRFLSGILFDEIVDMSVIEKFKGFTRQYVSDFLANILELDVSPFCRFD